MFREFFSHTLRQTSDNIHDNKPQLDVFESITFDTDSAHPGVDNRCTACISYCLDDFIAPPTSSKKYIVGFGGNTTRDLKIGTLKWTWLDYYDKSHAHLIPNSYYVPSSGIRLLSPQHWIQHLPPHLQGTEYYNTFQYRVVLQWGFFQHTVPLTDINCATLLMKSENTKFNAFCSQVTFDVHQYNVNPICSSVLFDCPLTILCQEPILTTLDFDDHTPPKEPICQEPAPPPLPAPQYQGPMEV
jgi:hypothetical protein